MNKYIALLRGINVSGQKKIKMSDLKLHFESIGFTNIQTYIQSGNIVFCSKLKNVSKIKESIENKILEVYNFSVPTMILTKPKLEKTMNGNPFNLDTIDFSKVAITFLESVQKNNSVENIKKFKVKIEEFVISEDVIYLYCPNGFGRTKLTNNLFETKLKVTATTRNWKTSNKLLEMISETNCGK